MIESPLLAPERAERLRRSLVILAAIAGLVASIVVLSSQEVTDFLREGPVRLLDIRGDTLQLVLGVGTAIATAIAIVCFWAGAPRYRYLLATIAVAGGRFLVYILFAPAVVLLAAAAFAELSARLSRERLVAAGPRYRPLGWTGAGFLGVGASVALIWATVWLVTPLFDEGTELNEMLAFDVEGVQQPIVAGDSAEVGIVDVVNEGADPSVVQATAQDSEQSGGELTAVESESSTLDPSGTESADPGVDEVGSLISQGELQGADSFHTGRGQVLLVQSPTGETILRFQDFAVRNGPDLRVYLSPDPGGLVHADGAISLGKLRGTSGFINYEVPASVDPTVFRSLIIYCEPFGVVFATAVLS